MKWRARTVSDRLDVKGRTVNQIMSWYFDNQLIVNRKYQRKLVWSLEEKKLFIDSIICKYPTPSIILASYKFESDPEKKNYYEIIDGLQRLNAIVSFVNGEFGILYNNDMHYFDLSFVPSANVRKKAGELTQKHPVLPFEICQDISDYEMPIVLTEQDPEKIEQIFGRINSSGKKLSAHDLRQASSLGDFPDLVRRIACRIRGEYTYYDEINLSDIAKISIGDTTLNYGVNANNIFWRKHDLINFYNLRRSKDEELIASLLASILIGDSFCPTVDNLNSLYQNGSNLNKIVTSKIDIIGKDKLEFDIYDVFCHIDRIFIDVDSNFTDWIFSNRKSSRKDDGLVILVLALYQAYREGYIINNYISIANKLRDCSDSTLRLISEKNPRYDKIMAIKNILYRELISVMRKEKPKERGLDEATLCKLLSLSCVECQMVEFKIGISYFNTGEINNDTIRKIAKTLVAMANTNSESFDFGYVIIGIANDNKSALNWEKNYESKSFKYGDHFVTGVIKEAISYHHDLDLYTRKIGELINAEPISKDLKEYILSNYRAVSFLDTEVIMLTSKKQSTDSLYDGKKYIRQGSETIMVS